jgi:hypothetical protein
VYLTQYQQLPNRRSADLLQAVAGIALSSATLCAMVLEAAACSGPIETDTLPSSTETPFIIRMLSTGQEADEA